jgi:hypothetical protein
MYVQALHARARLQQRGASRFLDVGNSNHVVFAPIDSAETGISCAHISDLGHLTLLLTVVMYSSIGKF